MSIIIRGDDNSPGRKGVKLLGKTMLHFMQTNKKSGDHIEVTERIEPGTYKLSSKEEPRTGHIMIDLTPGKE